MKQALGYIVVMALLPSSFCAARVVMPLDGIWFVEEGTGADMPPASFSHVVSVPGLANQAKPPFPDVDHYETHEFVWTMKRYGICPSTASCEGTGRTQQKRKYLWYARTFKAPERRGHARLVIHKAQFGTAVWLNGRKIGEREDCFTAGRFDLVGAMRWNMENRLVVRIGAHPGALPDCAFWGSDGEKGPWTPGIYDSVELQFADEPAIEGVQIAPRIATSEIVVQTRLKNHGAAREVGLCQRVTAWKEGKNVGAETVERIRLDAGEEKTVMQVVRVPDAILWSPENPFLYVLHTSSDGDSCSTRFGMREFHFDARTRLPMLNGKVCFLRGASLTLHRFFGDPKCGGLPWDDGWVRKFLAEIPRRMNWNAFRICIGPAPQRWLDIADEAGLLLQYEFPIWSDRPAHPDGRRRHQLWKEGDIERQLCDFVRDNWNHPSVVMWDASNETQWDFLRERLVPAARALDLSRRPWDNGYAGPQLADDPYETHPYKFSRFVFGNPPPGFEMTALENETQQKPGHDWETDHAGIINEYDWLWLHRDGTPSHLTRKVYDALLGPDATPAQRFALNAYLLGGLTEYWRAHRRYAGVLYLAYLDGDLPNAFTCDNFADVAALKLEPQFEDYMREAFKPIGIYIDFWQPTLPAGLKRAFRLMLVNDMQEGAVVRVELSWLRTSDGVLCGETRGSSVELAAAGQNSCVLESSAPVEGGHYVLMARAHSDGKPWSPVISRRKVIIVPAGAEHP